MSLENNNISNNNNDGGQKHINDQVREVLSGLDGDNGEFLSKSFKPTDPANWGKLVGVTLAYQCPSCSQIHYVGATPENFIELFFNERPIVYFENFRIGVDLAAEREQITQKVEELLNRRDAQDKVIEQGRAMSDKMRKLADQVQIENSHLKTENTVMRRELDRVKAENEQFRTDTALDFQPDDAGRRWSFWTSFKGFRLIGRLGQGQEGK